MTDRIRSLALAAALAACPLGAQAPAPPKPAAPATASAPLRTEEWEYLTTKDFRTKVFVIKHVSARQLERSLTVLTSGFKGSHVFANEGDGLNTISVRDFPENITAIEDAIQRLDVAQPALKEVEYHIHVLFASKAEGPGGGSPDELKDVLASLKSTLSYRSYTPAASFVQRAQSGSTRLEGSGEAEMTVTTPAGTKVQQPITFRWKIRQAALEPQSAGPARINLPEFELAALETVKDHTELVAQVHTELSLRDGDKVVVGTSVLRDRGLIVVLIARVLD